MKRIRSEVALTPLTVAATAWLAWSVLRFPSWTVDDAFIVARYAENAVAHGELAFNAGAGAADRVEGFTSPLAMLVALLARVVSADPIGATKLLCVAAALAGPVLVVQLARALRAAPLAGGLAALMFAVYPEHAMHAASGLETELFAACVLGLFVAFGRLLDPRTNPRAFVVLGIVTTLARPEGVALVAILGGAALLIATPIRRRALARSFALGIALPLAVLSVARLAYYGALLPNTFHAKRGSWNGAHASDLGALVDIGLVDVAVIALATWLLARVVRASRVRLAPRVTIASAAAVVALLVHLFAYARSEPIMDYGRRFAWHGIAFVAVLIVGALDIALRAGIRLARRRDAASFAIGTLALFAVTAGFLRGRPAAERERLWASKQEHSVATLQLPAIAWVVQNTPADALVAVYQDAGRLPLFTGRRTVDFGKLNDRVLARSGSDPDVVRYFFERRPDVVVFGRRGSGKYIDSGADAIVADARFAADYEIAQRIAPDSGGDSYEIYRQVRR